MTDAEQRRAAKNFAREWQGRGDEKSETHNFWIELLSAVLGMTDAVKQIEFEKRVQLDHTSFIDGYIPSVPVLIEQKSIDVDLRKKQKQSDGTELTPFQQAKRYADNLGNSERPRYYIRAKFSKTLSCFYLIPTRWESRGQRNRFPLKHLFSGWEKDKRKEQFPAEFLRAAFGAKPFTRALNARLQSPLAIFCERPFAVAKGSAPIRLRDRAPTRSHAYAIRT